MEVDALVTFFFFFALELIFLGFGGPPSTTKRNRSYPQTLGRTLSVDLWPPSACVCVCLRWTFWGLAHKLRLLGGFLRLSC